MQRLLLTGLGAATGLTVALLSERNEKREELVFQQLLGVRRSDSPYLGADQEVVELLYTLGQYREVGPELFLVIVKNFDKICAFYQNAQDRQNSTSRMGDVISVGSLRVTLLMSLRNMVKLILHHTHRDIQVKQKVMLCVNRLSELLDGMRNEMKGLVEQRVYERQQKQKRERERPAKRARQDVVEKDSEQSSEPQ